MAIRMKCAHCRRAVAVTRRAAGTQVPCPVCRQAFEVPAITAEAAASPQATPAAPINYHLVGVTATAAIGVLAVLTLVATAASRQPSYRQWHASEASGRPTPAMRLAYLDRPLFDEPINQMLAGGGPQTVAAPPLAEMKYEPPAPLVISRRDRLDDEELRKQLLNVPVLDLYKNATRVNTVNGQVMRVSFKQLNDNLFSRPLHDIIGVVARRPDLAGLPMIPAPDCQLGLEPARHLQTVSTELRTKMFGRGRTTLPADPTEAVREVLQKHRRYITIGDKRKETFSREGSIPAVMQMLCVESRQVRQLVVDHLEQINDKRSSQALAKLALFDLSAKVRADAVEALRERPRGEVRQTLLDGLRYPWAPVADHAAETLIALEDTDALPALKELANLPNPAAPVFDRQQNKPVVREMVRINHLGNCMLCHAPAKAADDLVRGLIATPGEPLRPPGQYYLPDGSRPVDVFVRADITYLRQDFSVVQPVDNAGAWPSMQRFDYLVRNRPLSDEEARELARRARDSYPQQQAVAYAIRKLSGLAPKPLPPDEVTFEVTRR